MGQLEEFKKALKQKKIDAMDEDQNEDKSDDEEQVPLEPEDEDAEDTTSRYYDGHHRVIALLEAQDAVSVNEVIKALIVKHLPLLTTVRQHCAFTIAGKAKKISFFHARFGTILYHAQRNI